MENLLFTKTAREHHFSGIEGKFSRPGMVGLIPPAWVQKSPLYSIYPRSFSKRGRLQDIGEKIPDLKSLGIRTIWLMPIHQVGDAGRKGSQGSPYAIRDHKSIADDLGGPGDLHALIKTIHENDMRLILDFVGNHAAKDHIYPHLLSRRNIRSSADWTDVSDFDFSGTETSRYLLEVMRYWVETFDIDGYRCDVAGLVPDVFWEEAVENLFRLKPDLFLLAEWQRPALHEKLFHAGYDWALYLILKDIRNHRRPPGDIIGWETEQQKLYPGKKLLLRFTENHDLPRTMDVFGTDTYQVFAGLPYCLEGLPLIYAGQEWGIPVLPDLFEKDPVPWHKGDQNVYQFYHGLIDLRWQHPALAGGNIEQIFAGSENVLTFRKYNRDESLIVVANFDADQTVTLPAGYQGGFTDLLSGKRIEGGRLHPDPFHMMILLPED